MPLPERDKEEEAKNFVSRCMSSDKMKEEYKDSNQRLAVCINQSRAAVDGDLISMASEEIYYEKLKREANMTLAELAIFMGLPLQFKGAKLESTSNKVIDRMQQLNEWLLKKSFKLFKCRREFLTSRLAARVSQPRKPNSDDSDNSDKDYVLELNTYDCSKLPDSDNRITLFVV